MARWWNRIANERGQWSLPSFLNPLLQGLGQGVTSLFNPASTSGLVAGLPNNLVGGGLLVGSALQQEPGEVTQARQFLRNRFTSPTALSEQFAGQLGGLSQQFQPLLTQQRQQDIADIQQRFTAAFPKTVGAQGPEFGTLGRYIAEQALPREQGLLGNLGLSLLGLQGQAAGDILNYARPNPLGGALGQLGSSLLLRDLLSGGGQAGAGQGGLFGGPGTGLPGMGPGGGFTGGQLGYGQAASGLLQMATQAGGLSNLLRMNPQLIGQVSTLLGSQLVPDLSGALTGIPGFALQTSHGVMIPADAVNLGTLGASPVGAAGVDFGLPGAGLLGPAGFSTGAGLFSSLASAGLGYGVGSLIGQHFGSNQFQGGLGGAAGGAASGFAVGGPVGAVIGAIAGGIGGAVGQGSTTQAQKQASIQQETQLTAAQRPTALQSAQDLYTQSSQAANTFTAQQPALAPVFNALWARQDPGLVGIVNQLKAVGSNPSADSTFPATIEAATNLFSWIDINLNQGSRIYPPDQAHLSESNYGLLYSPEIGKFNPGLASLNGSIGLFNQLAPLVNQLVAYLQSARGA